MKILCRAGVLDDGQPGSRIMGETGGAGGGDGDCFTLALRRAWQLTALRLGEERAMSFGIDVRRLRLGSCCASACWRPFRLRLWGQLALLAWLHRIFPACCWEKIIAFICPEASLSVGWCYRWLGSVEEHHSRCHFTGRNCYLAGRRSVLSEHCNASSREYVMSGLTINALCAGYGKRRIIEHLSISTLPRGEVTVLLGPNGCGKSTLLRA